MSEPWFLKECSDPNCWCYIICTENGLKSDAVEDAIACAGCLERAHAEQIVREHNAFPRLQAMVEKMLDYIGGPEGEMNSHSFLEKYYPLAGPTSIKQELLEALELSRAKPVVHKHFRGEGILMRGNLICDSCHKPIHSEENWHTIPDSDEDFSHLRYHPECCPKSFGGETCGEDHHPGDPIEIPHVTKQQKIKIFRSMFSAINAVQGEDKIGDRFVEILAVMLATCFSEVRYGKFSEEEIEKIALGAMIGMEAVVRTLKEKDR